jgi:sec-independent protein translocase protein TatA
MVDTERMFDSIGPLELAIVAIIAILVLGPKRLPAAGRGVGKSMREFKAGISGISGDSEKSDEPDSKTD